MLRFVAVLVAAVVVSGGACAQSALGPQEAHGYTRYELLSPGSAKFKIIYDITAVRPGATAFFNPIRKGSIASDESVIDLATGLPLRFAVVTGEAAKTSGLPDADPTNDYIRVELSRLKLRATPGVLAAGPSSEARRLGERAKQTRDIVYFLQPPETHAFDLYHDYTEEKPGASRYINVVRTGSTATNPSARNLDTGEAIPAVHLAGAQITKAGIDDPELGKVTPQSEVVVFNYPPLKPGQSIRLRMSETYTDAGRYGLKGDELVFDRTLGRAENAVVLPKGWVLTNSTAPAVVSQMTDGRTRLDFNNPRPDEVEVLITARRAAP